MNSLRTREDNLSSRGFGLPMIMWKGKAVPTQSVKAYRGDRGIHRLILNHGTRWRWVAYSCSGCSPPLPPPKGPGYLLIRRLAEFQKQAWLLGKQKNLLPLAGFEHRSFQPAAQSIRGLWHTVPPPPLQCSYTNIYLLKSLALYAAHVSPRRDILPFQFHLCSETKFHYSRKVSALCVLKSVSGQSGFSRVLHR
jgi:hypothetical protein